MKEEEVVMRRDAWLQEVQKPRRHYELTTAGYIDLQYLSTLGIYSTQDSLAPIMF